ncbi:hypothetical protein P7K49_029866 [Saguinus oedipus]|uniref:Uncharacterized protein n=1 Tax=Saguinus oedipus TaxID=9490 RepID=A0ABQ9UAG0_SAGOE|nr:hypothetical protein P7K49_029866 [Saguinus oedipus]
MMKVPEESILFGQQNAVEQTVVTKTELAFRCHVDGGELKKAILVAFANKKDMEQAMTPSEMHIHLGYLPGRTENNKYSKLQQPEALAFMRQWNAAVFCLSQSPKCSVHGRISKNIPTTKDVEPLLEIDGDIRNFEVFLSSRTPVLVARDVKVFLPCTVNLDPKLREIIADVRAAREQISIGGLAYPPLPLHEGPPRAPSGYSQPPSVCSSTSFNGPFAGGVVSPQPHSSYYSGMTGPQHPFYNRPFFAPYLYTPRYYPGASQHLISRPSVKTNLPRDQNNGLEVIKEDAAEGLSSPTDSSRKIRYYEEFDGLNDIDTLT